MCSQKKIKRQVSTLQRRSGNTKQCYVSIWNSKVKAIKEVVSSRSSEHASRDDYTEYTYPKRSGVDPKTTVRKNPRVIHNLQLF